MSPTPPVLALPPPILEILADYPEARREAFRRWFQERVRPCYLLAATRAASGPQRVSIFERLMGRTAAAPVLPADASKFGGQPYLESRDEWPVKRAKPLSYLGQINFSAIPAHVDEIPAAGILALYLDLRWSTEVSAVCRWYPSPDVSRVVPPGPAWPSIPRFEAEIHATPSWNLPMSDGWDEALQGGDPALFDAVDDWRDRFDRKRGAEDGVHELFPQASSMLLEAYDAQELDDPRTVLRIMFDVNASFSWGSNTLYFLIDERDFRAQRYERVYARVLNA